MKAKLIFKLPEDETEYHQCTRATYYYNDLWKIREFCFDVLNGDEERSINEELLAKKVLNLITEEL